MEEQTNELDIREYLRILLKRRWTIITIFTLVLIVAGVNTYTAIPIYRATARIVIERDNPNLLSIQEVMAVDATGSDYYQTQYQIITSRTVARQVIKELDLSNSPEFKDNTPDNIFAQSQQWFDDHILAAKQWLKNIIKTDSAPAVATASSADPASDHSLDSQLVDSQLVTALINRIQVNPVRNSRLVDISVEAKDRVMSSKIADAVVDAYINHTMEIKLEAAKDAVKWLTERIEDERQKVEKAENDLLRYKEKHEILTDFSSDTGNITAEKLASLNTQVIEAESRRVEAETRFRQAADLLQTPEMLDSIPEVLSNELVNQIKKLEVTLKNRQSELSQRYGDKHPQMIAVQSELDELQKRKENEAKRIVVSLENEWKLAQAREQSLKEALAKQRTEILNMNQKAIQYNVLRRQAESSKHIYDLLINRFKEASLTEEMKAGNIRVVDRAEVPRTPVKPNKKRDMMMSIAIGLALGIGFAFFIEYMDNTIKSPDDIKKYLAMPYLGPIPAFDIKEDTPGALPDLITLHSPKSRISESFRGIRTNILFSSPENEPRLILITSADPSEGKTVCSANLAVAMAQSGRKTIVLDCDMRKPRIHQVFGVKNEIGVCNILIGANSLEEATVSTEIQNLDFVTAGTPPPNPSEIIGSNRMISLINTLKEKYDKIIIDSPPLSVVTDSVVLAQLVDGIVLIVRAGEVPRQVVINAMEQLRNVNVHLLGVVLNGVSTGKDSYYYNQYRYGYYYSKQEKT